MLLTSTRKNKQIGQGIKAKQQKRKGKRKPDTDPRRRRE